MSNIEQAHEAYAEAASALNWYEVAKLLHESAQVLHDAPQGTVSFSAGGQTKVRRASNRAVFLLAAFAMENLLKSFIVREHPEFTEGGRLSRALRNRHGLVGLQGMCKQIPSPVRTRHVLETLAVGINSWARYPCATSAEHESEERAVTPEFWAEYNVVFSKYSARLESLLSEKNRGAYGGVYQVKFIKPPHVA